MSLSVFEMHSVELFCQRPPGACYVICDEWHYKACLGKAADLQRARAETREFLDIAQLNHRAWQQDRKLVSNLIGSHWLFFHRVRDRNPDTDGWWVIVALLEEVRRGALLAIKGPRDSLFPSPYTSTPLRNIAAGTGSHPDREPILSVQYDPATWQTRLSAARAARATPPRIEIPQELTKAQRWQTRKALIAVGNAAMSGRVRAAAERLARNNVAVEKARLSDHVYEPSRPVPEGWANRSGDTEFLDQYGLKPKDLKIKGSNFGAQVYEPDAAVFGNDMKPTLAFKGTEMTNLADWSNNVNQSVNIESEYYARAVRSGTKLTEITEPIDITGHSLGGGLCSAASVASGKDCWSFNAAGLHPKTVEHYGGQVTPSNINAYHVNSDILTVAQTWTPLPAAAGTAYPLPGSGSPVSRHFIRQAIDGIEQQKAEDISVLEALS
ncbi:DUF2974 domain-containing protein (plasmid) [Paraburkholderia sprentiae WSM5005]|uniref:DUF2974 domain-containing protein n=1 Tax=Paraburkholderia sprentiae WSM5005 TaxID=754502 RepID=A0A1I9YT28_9BURK|nr:DUF2974 domain-containing protein [Paraburkholderia sprentiae]APA90049.1 DUF2974 domain-containing protein [Paraburkholderia sprentiae WSM5005]